MELSEDAGAAWESPGPRQAVRRHPQPWVLAVEKSCGIPELSAQDVWRKKSRGEGSKISLQQAEGKKEEPQAVQWNTETGQFQSPQTSPGTGRKSDPGH